MKKSIALFSTDDPVVPLEPNRAFFKDKLGSEIIVLDGYNHFDQDASVMSIPELLQYI
jgi:hypothetical protein